MNLHAFLFDSKISVGIIVELNENPREIYVEAYTQIGLAEYIYQKTSAILSHVFSGCNPRAFKRARVYGIIRRSGFSPRRQTFVFDKEINDETL